MEEQNTGEFNPDVPTLGPDAPPAPSTTDMPPTLPETPPTPGEGGSKTPSADPLDNPPVPGEGEAPLDDGEEKMPDFVPAEPEPATAGPATPGATSSEKSVTIPESKLDELIRKIDEQGETIDMLKFAADKSRVSNWREKNKGKELMVVRVKKWRMEDGEDKYVVGWTRMRTNKAVVLNNRTRIEDQKTTLMFLGNETQDIEYIEIKENTYSVEAEVLERTDKQNGSTELKVRTKEETPKEFLIDILFIN